MRTLVLHPTQAAQWPALVRDAEASCATILDEDTESYLVFVLMRLLGEADLAGRVMAVDFLEGLTTSGAARRERLRDVGDHCLVLSGLFPHRTERRLVRIGYFVALGRTAYQEVAELAGHALGHLFDRLSGEFVRMMEVLQAMRELSGEPALTPLEAHELWSDTGSRHAPERLQRLSGALPLHLAPGGSGTRH